MIIIISARSSDFEGSTDERFGRARWLIKVHTDSEKWQSFPNPGASESGGAGVAAAQFVIDHKADAVVSGDFGPHAARALSAARIEMKLLTSETHTVKRTLELFIQGKLPTFQP